LTSRPEAFLILIAYAVAWPFLDPHSFDWHGVATLITWAMTLFIQRAEHRDTQALHAKLDELLGPSDQPRRDVARIDDKEPEDIEKQRQQKLDQDD
jgi:low affinity Fe/Cu permease